MWEVMGRSLSMAVIGLLMLSLSVRGDDLPTVGEVCPPGALKLEPNQRNLAVYGCECYVFKREHVMWATARDRCANSGGRLVKITAEAQQEWLADMSSVHFVMSSTNRGGWTGLRRERTGLVWHKGGGLGSFTFWARDEPDEVYFGQQDCVYLKSKETWHWADYQCDRFWSTICQYDVERLDRCLAADGFHSDERPAGKGFRSRSSFKWFLDPPPLSTGALIGIIIGALVVLIILTVICACLRHTCAKWCKERRKKNEARERFSHVTYEAGDQAADDDPQPSLSMGGAAGGGPLTNHNTADDDSVLLSANPSKHAEASRQAQESAGASGSGQCRGGGIMTKVTDEEGMQLVVANGNRGQRRSGMRKVTNEDGMRTIVHEDSDSDGGVAGGDEPEPPPMYDEEMRLEYETQILPALRDESKERKA